MHVKAFLGSRSPRSIPRSASDSSGPSPRMNWDPGGLPTGTSDGPSARPGGVADPTRRLSVRIVVLLNTVPAELALSHADLDDECREATQRHVLERGVHRVALGVVQRQPRRPQPGTDRHRPRWELTLLRSRGAREPSQRRSAQQIPHLVKHRRPWINQDHAPAAVSLPVGEELVRVVLTDAVVRCGGVEVFPLRIQDESDLPALAQDDIRL